MSNIGGSLPALVAAGVEGLDLTKLAPLTLVEFNTGDGNVYTFAVIKPEDHSIALKDTSGRFPEPTVFLVQGSTVGGSAVKWGWIGVGMRIRMKDLTGGLLTTSALQGLRMFQDEPRAKEMVEKAEASAPREATPAEIEDAKRQFAEFVTTTFAGEHLERVQTFLKDFASLEGQGVMLGILDRAREVGKLVQALEILEKQFKDHWSYRRPEYRGTFFTESDVAQVQDAYRQLGLPLPA